MSKTNVDLARVFACLSDETRLGLVKALSSGEKNVMALCARLKARQPTVSHHLGILRAHRPVEARRDGKCMYYRLAPRGLTAARNFLSASVAE